MGFKAEVEDVFNLVRKLAHSTLAGDLLRDFELLLAAYDDTIAVPVAPQEAQLVQPQPTVVAPASVAVTTEPTAAPVDPEPAE